MPDIATHFCARRIGNVPGERGNMDQCEGRVAIQEQPMVLHDAIIRCRWCGRPTCVTWGNANDAERLYVDKDGVVTEEPPAS